MNDFIGVAIATIIVLIIGYPVVKAYERWKKIMRDVDTEANGERGENDVLD